MKLDPAFLARANRNLNLGDFDTICRPQEIVKRDYQVPHDRQYILRMMLRSPETNGLQIPAELDWLKSTILDLDALQKANGLHNPYVYVTVRHGVVTSTTDDIWHVDGFSMRQPHVPEQNYFWTDRDSTEYAEQAFPIPTAFDPAKHHLHWYLDERVKPENIRQAESKTIYLFDPYFVHRRPKSTDNTMRTFWRLSFIPIEIEDGQCQQNPLLPIKFYKNDDIRNRLTRFAA